MSKFHTIVAAIACASATVAAQQTAPAGAPTAPALPSGGNQTVVIAGCVSQGATADKFDLMNARMSNDSPTGTAQPSREDARNAPGAAASATTKYALDASNSVDLKPHVGHQVEITGRLAPAVSANSRGVTATSGTGAAATGTDRDDAALPRGASGSSSTGATTSTSTSTGASSSTSTSAANAGSPATLHVESVKMIAATCPAAAR